MNTENILIGVSNNIEKNISNIKIWSKSFKKVSNSKILLMTINSSEEEIQLCKNLEIEVFPINMEKEEEIYHKRYIYILDYIKNNCSYDNYLITDVFDVYFQSDPFELLSKYEEHTFFISSEGILFSEESEIFPWNRNTINKLYPNIMPILENKEILCCGVIAGKKEKLINILQILNNLTESLPNTIHIKDQPTFNVILNLLNHQKIKVFNINDPWVLHCHVGGPTPHTEEYGYNKKIIFKYGDIPKCDNGEFLSPNKNKYSMIHQYNRIPSWEKIIKNICHENL